jgi:hypothetical protein
MANNRKQKQETKHLHIMIPSEMHDKLNDHAIEDNMPVSMLVRLWISEKLKRLEK